MGYEIAAVKCTVDQPVMWHAGLSSNYHSRGLYSVDFSYSLFMYEALLGITSLRKYLWLYLLILFALALLVHVTSEFMARILMFIVQCASEVNIMQICLKKSCRKYCSPVEFAFD